jgi:hypothetical protein
VNKVHEGRPHIQDRIKNGEYTYIINTTAGRQAIEDSKLIRRSALQYKVHYDTTLNGGFATAMALNANATEKVTSVQEMHAQIKSKPPRPGRGTTRADEIVGLFYPRHLRRVLLFTLSGEANYS